MNSTWSASNKKLNEEKEKAQLFSRFQNTIENNLKEMREGRYYTVDELEGKLFD